MTDDAEQDVADAMWAAALASLVPYVWRLRAPAAQEEDE